MIGDDSPVGAKDGEEAKTSAFSSPFAPNPSLPRHSIDLEDDAEDVHLGEADEVPPSKLRLEEDVAKTQPSATPMPSVGVKNEPLIGNISITIENFEKKEGGYVVYLVVTQVTGVAGFSRNRYEVWRRFSDFLGLHEKLVEKLLPKGIVLPQPPEKSIPALQELKSSKTPTVNKDIAVVRTRLLQRYLNRLVAHGSIRVDCDVRDFLTLEMQLPKATNTSALSSGGVMRMLKSVSDAFSKMAMQMDEGDRWFEQMQSQADEQEDAVRRMHSTAESLVTTRRHLAMTGETFSKALSMLASCEESTALARCLSHLTETTETNSAIWEKQNTHDVNDLSETLGEYVSLFNSLRNAFAERHRVWQAWQTAQQNITKKREQKTRLELAGKSDKAAVLRQETEEAVQRADELETAFGRVSEQIKTEVARFDATRKKDIKEMLLVFLRSLLETQEQMLKAWQRFAPETDAIIA